jgi:hypothetical protein
MIRRPYGSCEVFVDDHTPWAVRSHNDKAAARFHTEAVDTKRTVRSDTIFHQIWLPDMCYKLPCGRVLGMYVGRI